MPLPHSHPTPRKLSVFRKQAELLNQQQNLYLAPLTTTFANGLNSTGVEMNATQGSGNECTGVNDGSKNSVLATYLSDAWNWGAEMFCEVNVRYIRKEKEIGGGYTVFYKADHDQLMWVHAVSWFIQIH